MSTYIACIVMAVFSMLILVFCTFSNYTVSKSARRGIIASAVLIMCCSAAECLGILLDGADPCLRWLHMAVKFAELAVAPFIPIVFANAFQPSKLRKACFILLTVHAAVQFLSIFFGITFYVDENNVYHHCALYDIYYVAIAVCAAYMVISIVKFGRRFQHLDKAVLAMIVTFVVAGVACQAIYETIRIVWLVVAIGTILFYIYYCTIIIQVDGLTELMNRSTYERRITSQRRRAVVLFFDVNDFKDINDKYGHQFGDECLCAVARALKIAYGKSGLCYRIGGDEFCVILDRRIDLVQELNADFNSAMAKMRAKEPRLPSISIGNSLYEPGSMTFQEAIANADAHMYEVKKQSKAGRDNAH